MRFLIFYLRRFHPHFSPCPNRSSLSYKYPNFKQLHLLFLAHVVTKFCLKSTSQCWALGNTDLTFISSMHFFTLGEILHIPCFPNLIPCSCFIVTAQIDTHWVFFHFCHPSISKPRSTDCMDDCMKEKNVYRKVSSGLPEAVHQRSLDGCKTQIISLRLFLHHITAVISDLQIWRYQIYSSSLRTHNLTEW